MDRIIPGKCFAGDCKHRFQDTNCVKCGHPDAIYFRELLIPCSYCGRKPKEKSGGCGGCLGRGHYVYPTVYEDCDCGGYEPKLISAITSNKNN